MVSNCKECSTPVGENNKFCSTSCSASFNNRLRPGRPYKLRKTRTCRVCGVIIPTRSTVCQLHNTHVVDWTVVTIDKIASKNYQRHSRIRQLARDVYKKCGKPRECAKCGYNKHVDICHIKDIVDYRTDTPVSVVNEPDNLIALCKNHHWELDHGLITYNVVDKTWGNGNCKRTAQW